MTIKRFVYLNLLIVLLFSACAPVSGDLAGTQWQLVSLDGNTQVGEALGGHAVTIQFEDAEVGGSAGCNSYGGSYHASGDRITISDLVSTLMACESDGVMDIEQAFLEALNTADNYSVAGTTLTMTGGGNTLVFEQM